jgi:hypothetical protein
MFSAKLSAQRFIVVHGAATPAHIPSAPGSDFSHGLQDIRITVEPVSALTEKPSLHDFRIGQ